MAAALATAADLPSEFSTVDPDEIAFALDYAARFVSVDALYEDTSFAHAMLAAHFLKRQGLGSSPVTGAAVTSRSVDDVSESYAVGSAPSDDELGTTSYGTRFRALKRLHPVVAVVA